MVRDSQDRSVRRRLTLRVVYAFLIGHALWVVLTHDWPLVAGLFVALALVYERRATVTLRRMRFRLSVPTP